MFDDIRLFAKVVELGSFSKVAQALHLAPSSVARRIDKLESELACSLFRRSTRQLDLTEEGQRFYDGALFLLEQVAQLRDSVSVPSEEPEGELRISVFESFGRMRVCPILPKFLNRYPKINLHIELENRIVDLHKEEVDLAIRIGRPQDSSLKARKLLALETGVYASPSYMAANRAIDVPEDLRQHNCLCLSSRRQQTHWYFHNKIESKKISVKGNLKSRGGTPLVEAAVAGQGLMMMSTWIAKPLIASGQLVSVLDDWQTSLYENGNGEIYVLYKADRFLKPSIRFFIDFLLEELDLTK